MKVRTRKAKVRATLNRSMRGNQSINPMRTDPTRTATMRRSFAAQVKKKYTILKGRIVKLVVGEDAFGLKITANSNPEGCNQYRPCTGSVPPEIGTAPIPEGHVRVYHYTKGDPNEVREKGLLLSKAKGHTYGEPDVVWGSTNQPDKSHNIVEFHVPAGDLSHSLEYPEKGADLTRWQEGYHHVGLFRDVKPEEIIGVHEPWHHKYHYIKSHPEVLKSTLAGEHDQLLSDPEYGPAVAKVKSEHGVHNCLVENRDSSLGEIEIAALRAEEPTEGQVSAGNYRKGHIIVSGLPVTIETPRGQMRSGKDSILHAHYGYLKRSEGADGDQVDVFVGTDPTAEYAYIVDQQKKDGSFDEHKVLIGFSTREEAIRAYASSYPPGWKVGPVTTIPIDDFKTWLKKGDTSVPFSGQDGVTHNLNGDELLVALEEIGRTAYKYKANSQEGSPDYGQLFYRPRSREVHYILTDGDDREIERFVRSRLQRHILSDNITLADEYFPPTGEGWIQVYPKRKVWNTNYQAFICNDNLGYFNAPSLIEVPSIKQDDSSSCGAAAAMSVGRYFGVGPRSLSDWKRLLGTDKKEGTHPSRIVAVLRALGLEVTQQDQMNRGDLEAWTRKGRPIICPIQDYGTKHSRDNDKSGHYLVVLGSGMGYIYAQDPSVKDDPTTLQADGRVMIREEDWDEAWHDQDADGNEYVRYGIIVGPTKDDFSTTNAEQLRDSRGRFTNYPTSPDLVEKQKDSWKESSGLPSVRWHSGVKLVPLDQIKPNLGDVETGRLENLKPVVSSRKVNLPPIVLRNPYSTEDHRFRTLDGNHRLLAAKASGHTHVPAIIVTSSADRLPKNENRVESLTENASNGTGLSAIRKAALQFSDEQLEGLYVWVNENLGRAVVDRLDWYDKSDDIDPAEIIGKVAEEQWGKENVRYQNEGARPMGPDWRALVREKVVNVFCPTGEGGGVDPSCSSNNAPSSWNEIKLPDHNSWKDIPAEPGYIYHATNLESAQALSQSSLKPHRPSYGTDQSSWPDGGSEKRSYFTPNPKTAWMFAPEDGKPALLRVSKTSHTFHKESGTGDIYTRERIDPQHLEVLTTDGWTRLSHVSGKGGQQKWLFNTFCPTGIGGGIDATCSPHEVSGHTVIGVLKHLGSEAGHIEHVAKSYVTDHIAAAVSKLPPKLQKAVNTTFAVVRGGTKLAFATWTAGQSLAEKVSKERGSTPEQSRRLRGILSTLDITSFKPISIGLGASGVGAAVIGAMSLLPPATAGYLAYSTARNPAATYRAAKESVLEIAGKVKTSLSHNEQLVDNDELDSINSLLDGLESHNYIDWYIAILHASLEQSDDLEGALDLADEAYNLRIETTSNVFCSTGEGGGVDPSCSKNLPQKVQIEGRGVETAINPTKDQLMRWLKKTPLDDRKGGTTSPGYELLGLSHNGHIYVTEQKDDFGTVYHADLFNAVGGQGFAPTEDRFYIRLLRGEIHVESKATPNPLVRSWAEKERLTFNKSIENTRWAFHESASKIKSFQGWLEDQYRDIGLRGDAAWQQYIESGYRKGASRSFDEANAGEKVQAFGNQSKLDFHAGTREQFLRGMGAVPGMGQSPSAEKVRLLVGRTFNELGDVNREMSNKMGRILADGLVQGSSPGEIAGELVKQVGLSQNRALSITDTELVRAHSEGQLDAMESMGLDEVGVAVEWTVNPLAPCEACAVMQGVVLTIEEARGLIPRHPRCHCAFTLANIGEDTKDQKRTTRSITSAIRKSAKVMDDDFAIEDLGPRPRAMPTALDKMASAFNAFCATGPGGGVDPSCGSTRSSERADLESQIAKLPKGHWRVAGLKRKIAEIDSGRTPTQTTKTATAAPAPNVPTTVKETVAKVQGTAIPGSADHLTKKLDELGRNRSNFVHLAELRTALPHLSETEFSAALHEARRNRKVTLSPAEGRHGTTEADRKAAVYDPPQEGDYGIPRMMLYASVRNVFCPTGKGGGVDATCSLNRPPAKKVLIGKKLKFIGAVVDAKVHAHAESVKHYIANAVGGIPEEQTKDAGQKDKKPYDVKVFGRPHDHDIEVKSMTVGSKQVISVHEDALLRKVDHVERTGNIFHTVVVDDRETYDGGSNSENYSGHRLYYRRGSGRYSLSTMYPVRSEAELKRLIKTPDDKLPEAARGHLPPPPPINQLRETAAKVSESRKARDKDRKERNKDKLREQARSRARAARSNKEPE